MIEVANRQRLVSIDKSRIASLASATLKAVGRPVAEITIAFVRDRRIRQLNRDFRGKNLATDVLSFPFNDEPMDSRIERKEIDQTAEERSDGYYLGDIVISTERALAQARSSNLTFEREVSELVIHGILHLCGYDHDRDQGEMNRLELKLRRKLLDA